MELEVSSYFEQVLQQLHPLTLWSPQKIVEQTPVVGNPWAFRKRFRCDLEKRSYHFPPLGDPDTCGQPSLIWLGFRWQATTIQPPPLPMFPGPISSVELAARFPWLGPKLALLPAISIPPTDLHAFVTGILAWVPPALPDKPRQSKKRHLCRKRVVHQGNRLIEVFLK